VNPAIRIEAMLPPVFYKAHQPDEPFLIATNDKRGLNAGVLFIRVNSWSVRFFALCISDTFGLADDQSSIMFHLGMIDPFTDSLFGAHFLQVPPEWFNWYPDAGYYNMTFQTHLAASLQNPSKSWHQLQLERSREVYSQGLLLANSSDPSGLGFLAINHEVVEMTSRYYMSVLSGTHQMTPYSPPHARKSFNWGDEKLQVLGVEGWANTQLAYSNRRLLSTPKGKKGKNLDKKQRQQFG
jgi:hypothetical protein